MLCNWGRYILLGGRQMLYPLFSSVTKLVASFQILSDYHWTYIFVTVYVDGGGVSTIVPLCWERVYSTLVWKEPLFNVAIYYREHNEKYATRYKDDYPEPIGKRLISSDWHSHTSTLIAKVSGTFRVFVTNIPHFLESLADRGMRTVTLTAAHRLIALAITETHVRASQSDLASAIDAAASRAFERILAVVIQSLNTIQTYIGVHATHIATTERSCNTVLIGTALVMDNLALLAANW